MPNLTQSQAKPYPTFITQQLLKDRLGSKSKNNIQAKLGRQKEDFFQTQPKVKLSLIPH